MVLKHYGKKELYTFQMEDCFDHPFQFNPDAIDTARRTRGASAVEHGQWSYGIYVYGKRHKYQVKSSEKSTLNAAMYGFRLDEEYLRVQAYLWSHGNYQLEAVSTRIIPLGKAITMRVVTLLIFYSVIVVTLAITFTWESGCAF